MLLVQNIQRYLMRKSEMNILPLLLFFLCGEESKETGRFRGRESNGDSVPLAHDLACKV